MSDGADDSDGGEGRRKRIRQACLNCRRKKVRCGGEKPVCTFCKRLSQNCIYAEDGRSHRGRSFSFQFSGDESSDFMMGTLSNRFSALEDRLSRIENMLERLVPPAASSTTQTELPMSRLVSHQPRPEEMSLHTQSTQDALNACFPPVHTLLFAADVFFRFCHNQPYSLFHEATFRQRLVSGELPQHLTWALLAAARRYSTLPDLQLNASDDAMFYAKKAWECLKLPWGPALKDEEVVPVIQSIVLIVNIEHPSGHCTSAYMKLGFALRLAMHSKFHLEPDASLSPILREERRRCFWSLYLQDKLISLTRERFSVLRDEDCRVRLPCSETAFREGREEASSTLDCFTGDCIDQEAAERCCPLALITVMTSTLNRVSQYVLQDDPSSRQAPPWSSSSPYSAISSTLLQLELHFGLNEEPKTCLERWCFVDGAVDQHLAGSFIYSKALFHLSHCLLHHPFLLQQRLDKLNQRAPPSFISNAWKTCRKHARSLTDLKDMRNHNVIILTSLYGYCTMVAGTIHVLSIHDENPAVREEGVRHFKAALEFLQELSCYWKHAALMANRLNRFRKQSDDRNQPLDPCKQGVGHSPHDMKVLWQSVDYASLSTPTRPGSPTHGNVAEAGGPELFMSPSWLFDFADLGMLGEGTEAFTAFPLLEEGNLLPTGSPT